MPFPNAEKKRLVDGDGLTDRDLYVALGIGTTELTGHGYSRGVSTQANNTSNAVGLVTLASGQAIYSPDDDSAQDSTHMRIYRSAAGDDPVTDWIAHNDVAAPANGQAGEYRGDHNHAVGEIVACSVVQHTRGCNGPAASCAVRERVVTYG